MASDARRSDPVIAALDRVALFKGLTSSELQAVARAARPATFAEGTYLFHQGDPATLCYVLTVGRVRLSQVTPEGQQVIMRFFGPGEEFAFGATISHIPYPLSAEAVEPSRALVWDADVMNELMARYSRLARNAVTLLVNQVHELQDRVRELSTERVERRVARTLLRLARQAARSATTAPVEVGLSRQELAEMSGTTLYTVSRILSQWEERGLVRTGRERVEVRDAAALLAIAEDSPSPADPATD